MAETDPPVGRPPVNPRRARRQERAERQRRRALSPVRIVLSLLMIPVVAVGVAMSIYVRTSPYPRGDAMRHLIAMAGCESAARVGLAPAFVGELGYHRRNDPDDDGISCDAAGAVAYRSAGAAATAEAAAGTGRMPGGAKFVQP